MLDAMNFDMISSSHNGMGCQIVLQGLFDIVHQPSMFEEKLSYSDFEKSFLAIPPNNDLKKGVKTEEKDDRENKGDLQIPVHQTHSSKTVEKKEVEDAEKPLTEYKCYYNPTSCKQSFPTKGLLDLHIDVHRGVHFLCSAPMCTKMFTSQARLRNHFEAKHKPIEPPPPPAKCKI